MIDWKPDVRDTLRSAHYEIYHRILFDNSWTPSAILGYEPLLEATWTADLDQPTVSGTLKISTGTPTNSLAPLMDSASGNRITVGSYFTMQVAITPGNVSPGSADYFTVVQGRVDTADMAADDSAVTIGFRDPGAYFLNTWISEANGPYSGPIEDVIRLLIGQWAVDYPSFVSTFLYVPESPGWILNTFPQEEKPLLEALRDLALQIGWDIRWNYHQLLAGGIQTGLRLWDPHRLAGPPSGPIEGLPAPTPSPDTDFDATEYLRIVNLAIDDADVRNVIEVFYSGRTLASVEDADSIASYGRRFMRISEEISSNINTVDEATRMANAAIYDLAQPDVTHSIELRYWPLVELGDVYLFHADHLHYDHNQTLAVVSFTHTLTLESSRTTINCRGKPAAANANWRLGKPKKVFTSLDLPSGPAPEGSIWGVVDSLDFP